MESSLQSGSLHVVEADYHDWLRWREFVEAHPQAQIYHHPAWLRALQREYGREMVALVCKRDNGEIAGVLPLMYTLGLSLPLIRHPVGKRLSSLPRCPSAGPLALDENATLALVRAAVDRVRHEPGVQLELKTNIADLDRRVDGLVCLHWRDTFVRGLPANEFLSGQEAVTDASLRGACGQCDNCTLLRFGNAREHHQVKWSAAKATKSGLRVRVAETENELRAWYQLYLYGMRRNSVPPRSYRWFHVLWENLKPRGLMTLYLVERGSGTYSRLVSGSILLQFGDAAFWAFTGTREEDFGLHPNDLALWHCLHASCRQGLRRFDFGEVAENHPELARFKAKWGTVRVPQYRYYYPASEPAESLESHQDRPAEILARRIWRWLPLNATAQLGDWAYRRL